MLKDMPQVTVLKLAGNSFLEEPIQPDILEMLQGRQTDIDVFGEEDESFELGGSRRSEEIKIIVHGYKDRNLSQ